MKIYLDLLPEEKKEEIKKKKAFWMIIRQELRFLIPIIVFISILFSINLILKIQSDSWNGIYSLEQSQKEYQELKTYEEEFRQVNSKISSFSRLQEGHLYWSNVFYQLSDLVPEEISINGLITKDYQVSLSGKAKNRNNLLALQEKIQSSECFSNVNVPLSNLVNKENVDFQIDFEVAINCLKNK
ncbi:MAG: PilN domain-containing protein [Candidatus Moranbacteria bacterium]|nr:PilN domain-containing protein [Candidatus Moranbacteria bacterium]